MQCKVVWLSVSIISVSIIWVWLAGEGVWLQCARLLEGIVAVGIALVGVFKVLIHVLLATLGVWLQVRLWWGCLQWKVLIHVLLATLEVWLAGEALVGVEGADTGVASYTGVWLQLKVMCC
jgi:uncharacterized membrane protein YqaE (UPF0057 family)